MELTIERLLILIFVLIMQINFIYLWMRFSLEEKGKKYPFFNAWFTVYEDFLVEKHLDSELSRKYRRVLKTMLVVTLGVAIILFLY